MDINIQLLHRLMDLLRKYLIFIVILILTLAFLYASYYIYQNVYKVAISPQAISSSDITARKQKVNIILITQVNNRINEKRNSQLPQILKMPFNK